ncbi:MAG: hypothetical protein ACK5O1_01890 [Holosporales bacterium]|jgi:hypothetical protein
MKLPNPIVQQTDMISIIDGKGHEQVVVGGDIVTAHFLPAKPDLLITFADDISVLVTGYYNDKSPILIDKNGRSLERSEVDVLTGAFARAMLANKPVVKNNEYNDRVVQVAWGTSAFLNQEHILPLVESTQTQALDLDFFLEQAPENCFVLCDALVLRPGDTFTYRDVVAGMVSIQHDEVTDGQDSLILGVNGQKVTIDIVAMSGAESKNAPSNWAQAIH